MLPGTGLAFIELRILATSGTIVDFAAILGEINICGRLLGGGWTLRLVR